MKRLFNTLFISDELMTKTSTYSIWYDSYTDKCWEDGTEVDEQIPCYIVWDNIHRIMCIVGLTLVAFSLVGSLSDKMSALIAAPSGVISSAWFFLSFLSQEYYQAKRESKNVILIRFCTKKVISKFDRDYERLCEIATPIREEEKRKKAEELERRCAEAAVKEEEEQRIKEAYRAKYRILLQYVETQFKVSTPDPERCDDEFSINLPRPDAPGIDTYDFDYDEDGLDDLIARIANLDSIMERRQKLRAMLE